ncbi:MAG: efflux RND transporter periplasmic adaptor subunit [Armatimonadota bacterium]
MKKKSGSKVFLIIVLIIGILILFQVAKKIITGLTVKENALKTPVKVINAPAGEMDDIIYIAGKLEAENEADLKVKVAGRIEAVYADVGQHVSKGQPLLKLENADYTAQLGMARSRLKQAQEGLSFQGTSTDIQIKNAQSNLEDAEHDYQRMKNLFDKGAVARQQLEDTKLRYDLAKTALSQAKAGTSQDIIQKENVASAGHQVKLAGEQLRNTVIYAPFDGVITKKDCKAGEYVTTSIPLLRIVNNSSVYFEGSVTEMDIDRIRPGQKARIEVPALGKTFNGEVAGVSEASDPENRSLYVKIQILDNNSKLHSGLTASATVTVKKYTGILIPSYILRGDTGNYFIVVPAGGKAGFKKVITGIKDEDNALITAGLAKGEAVISEGHETLKEGDLILIEVKK